jgi:F0F1-type ATP synthase epsilon subunit
VIRSDHSKGQVKRKRSKTNILWAEAIKGKRISIRKLSKASYSDRKAIKIKGMSSESDQRERLVMRKRSNAKR